MFYPSGAANRPEKQKRDRDDADRVQPTERSPIRISNFKKPNRKEEQQRNDRDHKGDRVIRYSFFVICFLTADFWPLTFKCGLRPIFPSQPKKNQREKRNEPAVAVLIVNRPFAAQLQPQKDPERGEKNDDAGGSNGEATHR